MEEHRMSIPAALPQYVKKKLWTTMGGSGGSGAAGLAGGRSNNSGTAAAAAANGVG
jgi:hypothetical protein